MTEVFCDSKHCGYQKERLGMEGKCTKDYLILKGETCDDFEYADEDKEEK